MSDNLDIWLWLTLVMKPNNAKLGLILKSCNYDAARAGKIIRDGGNFAFDKNEKSRANAIRIGTVREYKNFCSKSGITIISYDSEDYPKLLKQIENPPPVLFALGNAKGLNDMPILTGVGTRNISEYGTAIINLIAKPLAESGVIIASSTSEGADEAFHNAAVFAGGRSIAFPGCGVLETHPSGSEPLKKNIIDNGGAVISELFPDTKASLSYFKRRDAILAGIGSATLVAEAGEKSGSLITAEYAKKLARKVFCALPNGLDTSGFEGNIMLARAGASVAFDSTDIAEELGVALKNSPVKKTDYQGKIASNAAQNVDPTPKTVENAPPAAEKKLPVMTEELLGKYDETKQLVIRSLLDRPRSNEMVMNATGLPADAVFVTLMDLECAGVIALNREGYYYIPDMKYKK